MTSDAKRAGLATALSLGVNAALFLIVAWVLAVAQGFQPASLVQSVVQAVTPADEVTLVVIPEAVPETPAPPPPSSPPAKKYVQAPDDAPELAPTDATPLISSRNMRAASERPPSRDGSPGALTMDGIDQPVFDLRDSSFQDGVERPPESASIPTPPAPDPDLSTLPDPPLADRSPADSPPDPSEKKTPDSSPDEPAPAESDSVDSPPEPASRPPEGTAESLPEMAPPVPLPRPPDPRKAARPKKPLRSSPPRQTAADPVRPTAPPPRPTHRPDAPEYRPEMRKARSMGTVSNLADQSSYDAEGTPEGRYGKTVHAIVERNWRRRMERAGGLIRPGLVEIDFEIDRSGRVSNVRLVNPGEANPVVQDCALSAIIEARLPPPPDEMVRTMQDGISADRFPQRVNFLNF